MRGVGCYLVVFHNLQETLAPSQSEQSSQVRMTILKASLALYYLVGLAGAYTDSKHRQSSCSESQSCLPLSQCHDDAIDKLLQSIQSSSKVNILSDL